MKKVFGSPELDTDRDRIPLDGVWQFSYDSSSVGEKRRWFDSARSLPERIAIPGCSQARRYRSSGGNVRITDVGLPEHSSTILLRHGCLHPSWYKRRFKVPASWRGRRVHLHLGGVKPAGEFWINGHRLGSTLTSRSPVRCDLTHRINFAGTNTLTVRVWWPRVRLDGMYDCCHAWSGLYRKVWVEAVPEAHLDDVHVRASVRPRGATITVRVCGHKQSTRAGKLKVQCEIAGAGKRERYCGKRKLAPVTGGGEASLRIPMSGAKLWSTRAPNLYCAVVSLFRGGTLIDTARIRFGIREVATRGRQVLLNGTPIFLRGGCDDRIHPDTICPPADKEFYLDRIRKAKAYGFNYTKSAVETFTPEYLAAADELGYLVCQEMPFGMIGELRAARNDPPKALVQLWRRELENIVRADRNHPSVVLYSMTSEQSLDGDNPTPFNIFSRELPAITRALNPGALLFDVTSGSCMSVKTRHGRRDTDLLEEDIEHSVVRSPLHGKLGIPKTVTKPFVLHEWNWVSSLPDPAHARRFKSTPLYPAQVPEMVKAANANGLIDELPVMVDRSRRLKRVLRKEALEAAFEEPAVSGYHHWLIQDIPYCPEGVFNEWWEEPKDLSAEEFKTYNNDTVLVLQDNDRRSFAYGEPVRLAVLAAHFGDRPLLKPVVRWQLRCRGRKVAHGRERIGPVNCGQRRCTAGLGIGAVAGRVPRAMELRCELWNAGRMVAWNHWTLWFFPAPERVKLRAAVASTVPLLDRLFAGVRRPHDPFVPPQGTDMFITDRLTDGSNRFLEGLAGFIERGGRVLLFAGGVLKEAESCLYRTVAYNYGTTGNMGTVIWDHPSLDDFPHDGWCDLAFVPLIEGAYPVDLSVFHPRKIRPIIRSIGHQVTMHDKAYLFEVGMGDGTLLVCSLNLAPLANVDPAARYLLRSLVTYLADGNPRPVARIDRRSLKKAGKRTE